MQVTKKRASANKKNQETREFYSAAQTVAKNQSQKARSFAQSQPQNQSQSSKPHQPHTHQANSDPASSSPGPADGVSTKTAVQHAPPRQSGPAAGHAPSSASKRKHRKLAVNFEVTKVSEWAGSVFLYAGGGRKKTYLFFS